MSGQPDWWISAVRYDDDHSRIVQVKAYPVVNGALGVETLQTREAVVANIDAGKSYVTMYKGADGKWKRGAEVAVVLIEGEKFIRTDANKVKKDNLGNLPEF